VGVERRCAAKIWVFSPYRNLGSGEVGEAVLRGLLAESAKEQDSARRRGKWLLPEGKTVGRRAPVCCRGGSGAVAPDRKRGQRSERSGVVWSSRQSVQRRRTLCEGEASGVPRREKCSEQSAGALRRGKRGRPVRS
jgi:hypothetical protein